MPEPCMFISNQLVLSFLPYIMVVTVMVVGRHHPLHLIQLWVFNMSVAISKVTFPGPFILLSIASLYVIGSQRINTEGKPYDKCLIMINILIIIAVCFCFVILQLFILVLQCMCIVWFKVVSSQQSTTIIINIIITNNPVHSPAMAAINLITELVPT